MRSPYLDNLDELYHYGVKGMRWGIRKSPEEMLADLKKSFEDIKNKTSNAISSKIMGLKMKSLSKQIGKGSKLASKVMSSSINKTGIVNGKKVNYSVKKATTSSKVKAASGGKVGGSAKLTINAKSPDKRITTNGNLIKKATTSQMDAAFDRLSSKSAKDSYAQIKAIEKVSSGAANNRFNNISKNSLPVKIENGRKVYQTFKNVDGIVYTINYDRKLVDAKDANALKSSHIRIDSPRGIGTGGEVTDEKLKKKILNK